MNKIRNKILYASLSVALLTAAGCSEDFDKEYTLIPANLNPDKTEITFNANANEEETSIMTGAAKGSTWFFRTEGDVPGSVIQTTDRIIVRMNASINDALDQDNAFKAKTGKIILSEEAEGGLVVDKATINVTQQYYGQPGSTGTTDWDNGASLAYSWTAEGKGFDGQEDVVIVENLKNNTYAYRILGSISKYIVVEDEGEGASRTLKLSAKVNDTGKELKGYLMVTDKDKKIICVVRALTIKA